MSGSVNKVVLVGNLGVDPQVKPCHDLIPPEVIAALGTTLAFGAAKHGARDWEKGYSWAANDAALERHLNAWRRGETRDPESGLPPLWHAACRIAFLIAYEARGIGDDDRGGG